MKRILIGLSVCWIGAMVAAAAAQAATYPGTQPLPNGDFELGATFWTVDGDADIVYSGLSQNWFAVLGYPCLHDCLGYVMQRLAVPEERPVLGFWLVTLSYDAAGTGGDEFVVAVDVVSTVLTIPLIQATDTDGFELRLVDLSAWSGETIDLFFAIQTDGSNPSDAAIDDVFFAPAGYVFSDGFEAGTTVRWTSSAP